MLQSQDIYSILNGDDNFLYKATKCNIVKFKGVKMIFNEVFLNMSSLVSEPVLKYSTLKLIITVKQHDFIISNIRIYNWNKLYFKRDFVYSRIRDDE
jgi:hypothetical protein